MTIPESAVQWAIKIANDNTHGYSQASRWGSPDYDCSSFAISAYEQAGAGLKSAGAGYTGNLRQVALKCGFTDVTSKCNLITCAGMERGDILLYHITYANGSYAGHTAIYIGNNQIVHARGKSYGSAAPGDQGTEITTQNYYRGSWMWVLRYTGNATAKAPETTTTITAQIKDTITVSLPLIMYGSKGSAVKVWQSIIGVTVDGDFGPKTKTATRKYQKAHSLTVDGEVGKNTWRVGLNSLT